MKRVTERKFIIPTEIGRDIEMTFPYPITENDYDMLIKSLEIWKKSLTHRPKRKERLMILGKGTE